MIEIVVLFELARQTDCVWVPSRPSPSMGRRVVRKSKPEQLCGLDFQVRILLERAN